MNDLSGSFKWTDIGNIAKGRPALGNLMPIAVYRMFQYSFRSILEKNFGKDAIKHILVEAGRMSGMEFCRNILDVRLSPESFFEMLRQKMEEMGIALLRMEHVNFDNMIFILTLSEDLDCSGLPAAGEAVCNYNEGFIMGILETYTDRQFAVEETDCWSTGDGTCRFHVVAI